MHTKYQMASVIFDVGRPRAPEDNDAFWSIACRAGVRTMPRISAHLPAR